MPWDEGAKLFQGKQGEKYRINQALSYDEDENAWRIGVVVYLSPKEVASRDFVAFGLRVYVDDGVFSVRVADKMQQIVDVSDLTQAAQFFEFMVKTIKESFAEPTKARESRYGFQVQNTVTDDSAS